MMRPEVHHAHALGDVADHRQVVADQQEGHPALALDAREQRQDLRPDADVEGGDRLVGDDELGLGRQRAGDADALPLAAGELVRQAVEERLGGREADVGQQRTTRSRTSAREAPRRAPDTVSAVPRICCSVLRGLRLALLSWNTTCTRRRKRARSAASSSATGLPWKRSAPR
jgi:hypothetical protein